MQHNTDKEKATACQKAPDKTQMDAMIQRSKDYGLKVAVPNMKTDTQTIGQSFLSQGPTVKEQVEAMRQRASEVTAEGLREDKLIAIATRYKAHADKLAEALRRFTEAYRLQSDHDLECAEAEATKAIAEYEASRQ